MSGAIVKAVHRATCEGSPTGCKRIWPGSQKELAMLLVAQAVHETHLSQLIHDNKCRLEIGECDSQKIWNSRLGRYVYVQQSYSLWQLKLFRDIPREDWVLIESGRPGTEAAAWHAARRLSSAYRACKTIRGAISRYARGRGCVWKGAEKRETTWKRLMLRSE